MSIQALRERLQASSKAANHILAEMGDKTWTKEKQAEFDAHGDDIERTRAQIAAHEKMISEDREANFKDLDKKEKPGKFKSEQHEGFDLFLRKKQTDMSAEEIAKFRNTMSTTTGSQGGFTVQTLVATELVDILKSYGYMRKVAGNITTANGADLSYPTSDGTSEIGEIVAQNAAAASADPVFASRSLNTVKFGSKVVAVPIELVQDAQFDIQAMVVKRLRDRIGRIQNQKFTIGTGTAEPFGLTVAASIGKTGQTGQTLTIIYDDLVDMIDSLDAAYLDQPTTDPQLAGAEPGWMFSQTLRRVIRKIKDTAGRPIWTPSYDEGLTSSTPDRLLGYPVYLNNDMPVPAANAISLAFGNLARYMIRDAMEVTMFRFDDSAYMKNGQVGYLAWARAGGNLLDVNSVKTYAHSAT
ncbi:phage major capsid protein [Variovorax sp. GT1P44]|uniref:phage major capsid protein n=1 Tax=Variovorax sp. GT1P44 TaxID=3443742 RepID=UPI003F48F13F